jgi:hypothetical protein
MNYNIIESVAANSGDIVLSGDGQLAITGAPVTQLKISNLGTVISATAGVLQASTVTIATTPAANTTYSFAITQLIGSNTVSRRVSVTTPAVAPTATVVSNQFKTLLENLGLEVTASVGGTSDSVTTITAVAGYNQFTIVNLSSTTVATGTAGVYAVGLGSDLLAAGLTGFTSTNYYDAYPIKQGSQLVLNGGFTEQVALSDYTVYVNIGTNPSSVGANAAKVRLGYSNVARGFNVNAGVAVATQAATAAAIAAATTVAGLVAAVAPLGLIGVNEYNQVTTA